MPALADLAELRQASVEALHRIAASLAAPRRQVGKEAR
jgi:hypothetical protein